MDKDNTVTVKNMTNSPVTIMSRNHHLIREIAPHGASTYFDKTLFEQLLFEPGIKYMIDSGILYIEDMETKKELGIEPEDAKEPVNVIVLTDKQRRQYMVNLSLDEFKEKVDKLGYEQVELLADYATANKLIDFDKCEYIKKKSGRDIISAIRLTRQNQEKETQENKEG